MRSILAVFCIIFTSSAFGNLRDSVGVENVNGKQVVLHRVAAKESYYSISRLYHVLPKDIIDLNKVKTLQPGITLRIPTNRDYIQPGTQPKAAAALPAEDLIDYKVGPKETLFAIAKRFNTNIDEIKRINNLKSNNLSVGQIIKVRQGGSSVPPPVSTPQASDSSPAIIPADSDSAAADNTRIHPNRYGVTEKTERGAAVWISDEHLDATKMLALHRTAPIGTVIKITNPMSGKSTFAKVVGKYTENETTKDVIIVITKATADLLGALDKRFQVNIDYGVPNE
ncbi:LysM repeat protein [Arcticibacter tournemirensis]|uniref:LysM peptidoglycan-binding domain-containing protein n=1 Tax=Arcticibacter tournemirensis TaxID=699437 RepID=A0A4Q0MGQ9_9SPHI|nr:LysM peptidoglycan-binding domain-containing protein [Arcticibacter tournemirensis]KAA8483601.1 LysM peptidoglycan-binding domain-containing protein [Arcticibacter tournemirensis]RXF72545.1 LysM peptidoglycan-binding domain-containing protein [Arcticibacter tournemirensis]TQM51446.1 LysM repeat protein [Arcticibacter tournemirensis]